MGPLYFIIAATSLCLFVVLHLAQERWTLKMCNASADVNVALPKSCDLLILRLWIAPGIAALLLALIGFMRLHLGSFRRTRDLLHQIFKRISEKRYTGNVSSLIIAATSAICGTALLLWHLLARHGADIIHPKNTAWLSNDDLAQAYLGSLFLRQPYAAGSFVFPLGRLDQVLAPYGTNAAFMDPVFLLTYALKFIPSFANSTDQYFGVWLVFCYASFAICAALCARRMFPTALAQILATCILALFAPLLFRFMHLTLNLIAVVPLCCFLLFNDKEGQLLKSERTIHSTFLAVFAILAWLHPYLTALTTFLYFAFLVSQSQGYLRKAVSFWPWAAAVTLVTVPSWWLMGYIGAGIPASESELPKWFTANLNTFFNSFGYSNFLRQLSTATPGQYEGFGYLGLGILGYLFYTFSRHGKEPLLTFWREQHALALSGLIGLVLSMGTIVSLFSIKIELPIPLYGTLLATFRSTGRFIWIPAFVIAIFTLYQLVNKSPSRQTTLLAVLLGLQIWDFVPFRSSGQSEASTSEASTSEASTSDASTSDASTSDAPTEFVPTGLPSDPHDRQQQTEQWLSILDNAQAIVAYPPLQQEVEVKGDYALFWWLALRKATTVNIGYVARFDTSKVEPESQRLLEILRHGNFKEGDVYVVGRSNEHLIGRDVRAQCQDIGQYLACRL